MGPTILEGLRRAVSIDKPLGNLGNGYKIQDKHRGVCSSVKSHQHKRMSAVTTDDATQIAAVLPK